MSVNLLFRPRLYDQLIGHLLPLRGQDQVEQAAFVFARHIEQSDFTILEALDAYCASREDFVSQETDYLELTDEARAKLIKCAHDLHATLIEMHSHPGPWPAAFSFADRVGLTAIVPHMKWRLPGRPYVALVVSDASFDALVWLNNCAAPTGLDALVVGDRTLKPTNLSLKGW